MVEAGFESTIKEPGGEVCHQMGLKDFSKLKN